MEGRGQKEKRWEREVILKKTREGKRSDVREGKGGEENTRVHFT